MIVVFAVAAMPEGARAIETRTWTSNDGKTIQASLLRADDEAVTLRLTDGREAVVPVARLSEEDRAYLAELNATGETLAAGAMPEETKIDPNIEVEGGPRVFLTPHFRFETDQGVSKGFIGEVARVFEGTLHAVESLPLGIDPVPPEGMDRFSALFMSRESFDREIRASGLSPSVGPGTVVAGVYLPERKAVLVPFSAINAGDSGSQKTLRRRGDTGTLTHEITHQVMHRWLPLTPVWFSEGLASYMEVIPSQNGRFEFRNAGRGLKDALAEKFRIKPKQPVSMIHPADLLLMKSADWRGEIEDYRSALLLIYYFMHLDQPEKPGAPLAAYLHLLERGKAATGSFVADYNKVVKEFETKRLAFNKAVEAYNAELKAYRAEVKAYNERVALFNQQARDNTPAEDRVEVGAEPVSPKLPKKPEIPELLQQNREGVTVDGTVIAHNTARPALVRNRHLDDLAEGIVEAFMNIDISVKLKDKGTVYTPFVDEIVSPKKPAPVEAGADN